jgi:LysR family carnitine catabolism transcriptional activator
VAGILAGHLDLVALPTLAVDPVTPLVGRFRSMHPSITVRLAHPDDTDELISLVRSGQSELGITELPVTTERIVSHRLERQELVAVLPPGSPPPRRGRLDLKALAALPLVTLPTGTSTRDALDEALGSLGATAVAAVETDQREAIVPLVLAGAGTAVLPKPMALEASERGAVVAALTPRIWRSIGMIHRDAALSPAARSFLEIAKGSATTRRTHLNVRR